MADTIVRVVEGRTVVVVAGSELISPLVTAAAGHASSASDSAALAEQWASEDEDVVVAGGKYSAKHERIKAEAAAEEALDAQTAAELAAGDAAADAAAGVAAATAADVLAAEAAAAAAAASAAELSGTITSLGLYQKVKGRPVGGIAAATNLSGATTFVVATPFAATTRIRRIRAWGGTTGGNLTVRRRTRAGNDNTLVGAPLILALVANSLNTFDVDFTFQAGEYLSIYSPTTGVWQGSSGAGSADDGGYYSGSGDGSVVTTGTLATGFALQVGFDENVRTVTADAFAVLQDDSADIPPIRDAISRPRDLVIGRPFAGLSAGVAGSNITFVYGEPVSVGGEVAFVAAYATVDGNMTLKRYTRSGTTNTLVASQVVALTAGANRIAITGFPVEVGDLIGFYGFNVVPILSGAADSVGWYNSGAGNVGTFTDADLTTTFKLMMGVEIAGSELIEVADELEEIRRIDRTGGVFQADRVYLNSAGQSLIEGSDGTITTAQEYDNVGFPAGASSPTALLPLTVANTQVSGRGESPMYGMLGHLKELILENNGLAFTDHDYQLVTTNNGISGKKISELNQGTAAYNASMAQIDRLVLLSANEGKTFEVGGQAWGQGESDTILTRAQYLALLLELAVDYDADARLKTGQPGIVPTVCYQVSSNANTRQIALAQLDAARQSPLVALACPMYHLTFYDSLHINAASSKWLGGYFALAFYRWLVERRKPEPLMAVQHAISGQTIDLFFNKPGLVFDTVNMPAQTNHGFGLRDASNAVVALTGAPVIMPNNRVRLVAASGTPGPGWKVTYGDLSCTGKSPFTGGGGNLRDSQGDRITYLGNRMDSWAVLDEYLL